jgi:hypothetical protein
LGTGEISVFDALKRPDCWVCDILNDGHLDRCWQVDFDSVPRDALPSPGTILLPSHSIKSKIQELPR